ncbi:MAG: hypothetical protein WC438_00015 [Candidatus Pacearchaeota archaeon]
MSLDFEIGFEKKPEGIELVFEKQEFVYVPMPKSSKRKHDYNIYKKKEEPIILFYYPDFKQNSRDSPDWRANGYNICSLLHIKSQKDSEDFGSISKTDAEMFGRLIVDAFNGIFYDYRLDQFFKKGKV